MCEAIACHCHHMVIVVDCFRHFHLVLKKSTAVLANDFQVVAVNGDNVERIVDIRPAVYHGFLAGT